VRFRTACWLALAAAPSLAQNPASPPGFADVVDVNVVNVEVYVTDRGGNRVTDLKREDFAVAEDGKAVELTNFAAFSSGRRTAAPPVRRGAPAAAAAAPAAPVLPESAAPAAAAPDPDNALFLTIFLDDLHLRPETRARAVEQVRQYLAQGVRPGDQVMVVTHGLGMSFAQPFTADRAAIDAALSEAEKLPTYGQQQDSSRSAAFKTMVALNAIEPCGSSMIKPVEAYAEERRDQALRTIGALKVMINSLSGVPGRRAVLFVSDGLPTVAGEELFEAATQVCRRNIEATRQTTNNQDREPGSGAKRTEGTGMSGGLGRDYASINPSKYTLAKQIEDLAAHASANRVTLYTLQASGLRGFAQADAGFDLGEGGLQMSSVQQIQTENLKGGLTALAADTGGRAMLDANDFLPDLARMDEDFETYYSLGYTPAHAGDAKAHKVDVKVRRPGLRIRYRQTYRDKPALERAVDRTLAALLHGLEDNPLEIEVGIGEQTQDAASRTWAVPVQLKIPLFKLTILNQGEKSYQGKLRLLVATQDAKGGISPVRQVAVPLDIPRKQVLDAMGQHYLYTLTLKLRAGKQRVAVAVRDELGLVTSYLSREVTVGPPAAGGSGR
jgi:VWFA-related protein